MLTACVKATLRTGAGMRAREARLLGQQPAFAYPLGQPGGNTKASLIFARASRPEGKGLIDKKGETNGFPLLARSAAAQAANMQL